jgi:hypothetical protein
MLINTKSIYGTKLTAKDGPIGHVRDFYFDDRTWVIRYVVADTGSWLTGRLVLLSPHAFGSLKEHDKALHVRLLVKQIESSPSIESHKPVSRQFEEEYHTYYSWPGYWQGPDIWGMSSYPVLVPPPGLIPKSTNKAPSDAHLRSAIAVAGYHIEAVDGTIGHVTGFLFDEKTWAIRDLVVEAGSWFAGKEVRVSTGEVTRISYEESKVYVTLTKAIIQQTGEDKLAKVGQ